VSIKNVTKIGKICGKNLDLDLDLDVDLDSRQQVAGSQTQQLQFLASKGMVQVHVSQEFC